MLESVALNTPPKEAQISECDLCCPDIKGGCPLPPSLLAHLPQWVSSELEAKKGHVLEGLCHLFQEAQRKLKVKKPVAWNLSFLLARPQFPHLRVEESHPALTECKSMDR